MFRSIRSFVLFSNFFYWQRICRRRLGCWTTLDDNSIAICSFCRLDSDCSVPSHKFASHSTTTALRWGEAKNEQTRKIITWSERGGAEGVREWVRQTTSLACELFFSRTSLTVLSNVFRACYEFSFRVLSSCSPYIHTDTFQRVLTCWGRQGSQLNTTQLRKYTHANSTIEAQCKTISSAKMYAKHRNDNNKRKATTENQMKRIRKIDERSNAQTMANNRKEPSAWTWTLNTLSFVIACCHKSSTSGCCHT